jgi:hypothetical protein
MPLPADLKLHYDAVLGDLQAERDEIVKAISSQQSRLREINASIFTLSKRVNTDNAPPHSADLQPANQKYASMSVRWAILDLLMDSGQKSTADIAGALIAAGVETRAENFANNVSAVLSTTMKHHNEVEQLTDGKWQLTQNGKSAIEHIRTTPRFQAALRGHRDFAKVLRRGEP